MELYQCNGGANQIWTRPTSIDLRLQTQSNMCASTSGNLTTGSVVVLSVCNPTADSQMWIYDGRNLHPVRSMALCLTIQGGVSVDGASLILSACKGYPASAWVEYSTASLSQNSLPNAHRLCPVGSKVINISGRGGGLLHQITMTCDDSSNTVLGPIGGNSTPLSTNPLCTSGYTSMAVLSGGYVGQFIALCSGSLSYTEPIGIDKTNEAITTNRSLVLQGKNRIIGMQGNGDLYVESISMLYSQGSSWPLTINPSARPSAKPSLIPSVRPTVRPSLKRTSNPSGIPSSLRSPSSRPTGQLSTKPSRIPTIWIGSWNAYASPLYGTITPNLTEDHDSCPRGTKVVEIYGYGQDYVRQLQATYDDKNHTILGPWGSIGGIASSFSCYGGMKGWNITHGSYIGSMSFTCIGTNNSFGSSSIGFGNTKDFRTRNITILSMNQSIIGFRVYSDSFGINALRIEYADVNTSDRCYNSMGEETGRCPTSQDYLAILWGFVSFTVVIMLIALTSRFIRRRHQKIRYMRHDIVLPLK